MKKIALLLSALAFGANAAIAADLPVKAPPPPYIPEFSWTGVYVGANFGGDWTSQSSYWPNRATGLIGNFGHDGSFGVGGLSAGAQYQWANSWVLGVEFSWFSTFEDSQVTGSPAPGCPNVAFTSCAAGLESVITIGPRLGYAWHDVFFYGQGGYASGEITTSALSTRGFQDNFSQRHDGWFAGAGVDWAVWKGRQTAIVIGLDYKHVDLGTTTMNSPFDNSPVCANNCRLIKTSADVVQAKFSIKWDPITPLGPVVAKY